MTRTIGITALAAALAIGCGSNAETVSGATAALAPAPELYVGICGFSLVSYDPTETFRFYVEATRDDVGGLALAMTPLIGWDDAAQAPAPPASIDRAHTVGATLSASSTVADGAFQAAFGALDVPPAANTITGGAAHVERLTLDGHVSPARTLGDRFCAGLSGELTVPLEYELRSDENTCLFLPVAEGAPLPPVDASDFHCP
jgi:hypothetical protein